MKKILLFCMVLLFSVSMVFSSVVIDADDLVSETVSDCEIGGIILSGEAVVGPAAEGAKKDDGSLYQQMITLSEGSSISFSAKEGDVVRLVGAVPEDGSPFELMITSSNTEEMIGEASSDGGTVYAEYTLLEDGDYTLSSPEGSVSIYFISIG